MMLSSSNLNPWEDEAGGSGVQGHPQLYVSLEAREGYMSPSQKQK